MSGWQCPGGPCKSSLVCACVCASLQVSRADFATPTRTYHAPYRDIASLTSTTYIAVDDGAPSAVRNSIAKVYEDKRLLASTTETDGIILTVPYRDESGLGLVTTLVRMEFTNAVNGHISYGTACPLAHTAHTFDRSDTHHAFGNELARSVSRPRRFAWAAC